LNFNLEQLNLGEKNREKKYTKEEILKMVIESIKEMLEDDYSEVTLEVTSKSKFREDLGMDSFDKYELLYEIEEKAEVIIPEELNEFDEVKTVEEFASLAFSRQASSS
jgi:acyl carrier protein